MALHLPTSCLLRLSTVKGLNNIIQYYICTLYHIYNGMMITPFKGLYEGVILRGVYPSVVQSLQGCDAAVHGLHVARLQM